MKPTSTTNHWLTLLEKLPLTKSEQDLVARFEQEPQGKGFLPIAELLRSYQFASDAVELLVDGLTRHPDFFVARIFLVRELLERGELLGAWKYLDVAPDDALSNSLAQKLRFKLAVLLSDEKNARASLEKLKALSSVDHDLRKLVELFEAQGVTKARDFLMDVYKRQGIQVKVPTIEDVFLSSGSKIPLDPGKQTLLAFQIEGLTAEAEQFTVTSLENIAKHIAAGERGLPGLAKKPAVELDSTTLAEIYAKQGYYAKARDVYKRLLTMSPENEQLKLKYADMTRLERGQTSTKDIEHEQTETADRLAQVDIINRQMRFYQNLLEKL